jgi:hypothetical protein
MEGSRLHYRMRQDTRRQSIIIDSLDSNFGDVIQIKDIVAIILL